MLLYLKKEQIFDIIIRVKAEQVIQRWKTVQKTGDEIDLYLMTQSKKFMKYTTNVFLLHRHALRLQHWYFEKRHNQPKQQAPTVEKQQENKVNAEKSNLTTINTQQSATTTTVTAVGNTESQVPKKSMPTPTQSASSKFSKINGSNRLPKAAEKQILKQQEEQKKKEALALKQKEDKEQIDSKAVKTTEANETAKVSDTTIQPYVKAGAQKPPVIKNPPARTGSIKTPSSVNPLNGYPKITDKTNTFLVSEETFVIEKDANNNEKLIKQEKHNFKSRSNRPQSVMKSDLCSTGELNSTTTITQEGSKSIVTTTSTVPITNLRSSVRPITTSSNGTSDKASVDNQSSKTPNTQTRKAFQRATSTKVINQPQSASNKTQATEPIQFSGSQSLVETNKPEPSVTSTTESQPKKHSFKSARNTSTRTSTTNLKSEATEELKKSTVQTSKAVAGDSGADGKNTERSVTSQSMHTPIIGGSKSHQELKKNDPPKAVAVNHNKKWGERQHSWKPQQFDSVQALVEKGWQDAEQLKEKKAHSRQASKAKHHANQPIKEVIEEQKVEEIVVDAWQRAEEIKQQRKEEREKIQQRSKSKTGLVKPKWGERQTSWKAADFDSVQALIDQAWTHKDEDNDKKQLSKQKKKKAQQEPVMQQIQEEPEHHTHRESVPTKRFNESESESPLKRPAFNVNIVTENLDDENRNKTELAKRIEADKKKDAQFLQSVTHTDIDDASSYMCSQGGSPFKKARRTRDERRKISSQNGKKSESSKRSPTKKSPTKKSPAKQIQVHVENTENETPGKIVSLLADKNQNSESKNTLGEQQQSTSKRLNFESHKKSPLKGSPSKELNTALKDQEHHIFRESDSNIAVE
ncbi:UNKNOWN [Stylonychia lemnae]|uniref:Uncharacterized protein n=1 Tax=Stylonychia lemnae TaxID=5949 RepID=A0A078A4D6_STYLE|nr:UNKNOWN [Stylonychia lemnae]|eukprot:CDW76759.1 UNKNOWN [Stylonychia lemnae]